MALENLVGADKFLSALVPANPVGADDKREGDDHIRGIKNTLRNTFPNLTGAVAATQGQLDQAATGAFPAGITTPQIFGAADISLTPGGGAPSANVHVNGNLAIGELDEALGFPGQTAFGHWGRMLQAQSAAVAPGGTLDLAITNSSFFGNPGAFGGLLMVSACRNDFMQSVVAAHLLLGSGPDITTAVLGQKVIAGGFAYTLTLPSAGVVRFTNTQVFAVAVGLAFFGTLGQA